MKQKYGQRVHHSAGRGRRPFQRHAANVPPLEQLKEWLVAELGSLDQEGWERLRLKTYLQRTGHIALPPEERLRQLAILAEDTAAYTTQPRGWALLQRMYDFAARWDSHNPWIDHSRAISAMACANGDLSPAMREKILEEGRRALDRALSHLPGDGVLLSTMGQLRYAAHHAEDALLWFERALSIESDHPWARLYRAHCLHDLQRWAEAVEAYDDVPQAAFRGPAAWRMALLIEQRGWCRLQAGDPEGALGDFSAVVDRYAADLGLARLAMSRLLIRATRRHFPELTPRVLDVARQMPWQWALDMLEPIP